MSILSVRAQKLQGLVTRFSRTAQPGPGDFPVELQILSEIDLAKILSNAYFNDFDQQKNRV